MVWLSSLFPRTQLIKQAERELTEAVKIKQQRKVENETVNTRLRSLIRDLEHAGKS